MVSPEVDRITSLLAAEASPFRAELLGLGFEALAALPVASLVGEGELCALVEAALVIDGAGPFSRELVMPAVKRVAGSLAARPETLGAAFSDSGKAKLRAIVQSGRGPKGAWLAGAIPPDELQKLVGPIVQDVLLKFVAKLPVPGASGGSGSGAGGGGGSLLGMIGKQVAKSAGQIADVGKGVLGGLGSELERRFSAAARDFSQAAATDVRTAIITRLKSDDGQRSLTRIRDAVVERVLSALLKDVTEDLLRLPVDDIGELVLDTLHHLRTQPLFRDVLRAEVRATYAALGQRSARDLLEAGGLLEPARAAAIAAVDPGFRALSASPAFGDWLGRLLEAAR
jgi:hypothetical protein